MFHLYEHYEIWFARGQLILFMLGMGVHLRTYDFLELARRPRSFFFGFIGHIAVLPLVALGINHLFGLAPALALGLILVAAMPGGGLSKVFLFLGRGNAALSITFTAITTLATLVTVPATLHILAAEYVPPEFDMPVADVVFDVVVFLLAPALGGMLVGGLLPVWRHTFSRWAIRIGFVVVVAMIVGALGSGRIRPIEHGWRAPAAIILFCVLAPQLNMAPFYLLRLPRADRLAVGIEATMRNMNLALLLNTSLFLDSRATYDGVLYVVLFYAGAALPCGALLALNHRRLWRRERPPLAA